MKVHYTKVLVGIHSELLYHNIFQKYGKFFYMQDFVEKVLVGIFRATYDNFQKYGKFFYIQDFVEN